MIPLLELAREGHGGLRRWRAVHGIDCKLTIVDGQWQLKGLPHGLVDVALHVEPADRSVTITSFWPGRRQNWHVQTMTPANYTHAGLIPRRECSDSSLIELSGVWHKYSPR